MDIIPKDYYLHLHLHLMDIIPKDYYPFPSDEDNTKELRLFSPSSSDEDG
jgi:hypothetical protein